MATKRTAKAAQDDEKRRGWGRLRQLPSGRWQAAYTHAGRLHTAPQTFADVGKVSGEDLARKWLADERTLIELNAWTPPADRGAAKAAEQAAAEQAATVARVTFREYSAAWLARRSDPADPKPLAPRTAEHYDSLLRLHLLPSLGDLPLLDVDRAAVEKWHRGMGRKQAPSARAQSYSLLTTIMNAAVDDEATAVTANPCRIKGASSAPTLHRAEPATVAELAKMRAALPARFALMADLAAWCALRFGELAELRRGDVRITRDPDDVPTAAVLQIRRAASFTKGRVHTDRTKSRAGVRDVTVPPHLLGALSGHLDAHTAPTPGALLFPAERGGNLRQGTFLPLWYTARKAAGREDLHFHDLRHTGATMAAQVGATTRELMDRIGHSTPAMALHYQHTAAGRDAAVATALSRIVEPDPAATEQEPTMAAAVRELSELVGELRQIIAEQAEELATLRAKAPAAAEGMAS